MRKITQELADHASVCLNTASGEALMAFLVKEYGWMRDPSCLIHRAKSHLSTQPYVMVSVEWLVYCSN